MALELITTAGGETSNSYATLDQAAGYFEATPGFKAVWDAMGDQEQIAAMIRATRALDRLGFDGVRAYDDQALEFPRGGETAINTRVIQAQCEMILFLYQEQDSLTGAAQSTREVTQADVDGVVAVKFQDAAHRPLRETLAGASLVSIKALLAPWLTSANGFAFER